MNKGTLARKVVIGFIAALTVFAGLAPFAPGASAAANYTQIRIGGEDRFETAALIADAIAEATPTAVIARADIYPDALTGAYAAANNDDAPILLTRSDDLPQDTIDALEDKNVQNVILLGGPDAIDGGVENELEGLGYNVTRLFGATRYQTAIDIAENGDTIGTIDGERAALVASGENFPDALSGAPLSFAAFLPSLLVPKDIDDASTGVEAILRSYVDDVIESLEGLGIDRVYFIGGGEAVSEEIETMFVDAGFETARLAGENRGGTSVEVFEFGMDEGIYTNRRFGITRGDTFPDALAYAPLAGRARPTVAPASGAPDTGGSSNGLLLANGTCDLHQEVEEFIAEHSDTWTQGEILGGPEAICPELAAEIDALASEGFAGITLNETSTNVGGNITGNIQGEDIQSVRVSGCGLNNQDVTRDAQGNFTLTLPATQTTDCTLVFTTTFTDGRVETDTFQIDVRQPGEPDVTLSPTAGPSGTQATVTYSGTRPANITGVTSNCTITNDGGQTQNRTFTVTGTDNQVCTITTTVQFTDAQGGTQTFTDTFTITPAGQQPPGGSNQGVSAGPQARTAGPDLLRTTIINGVPNDTIQNQVRYTFDEPVTAVTPGNYSIQGPDSDQVLVAFGANVDASDPNSVIAQFTDFFDLRTFTIGTVDDGAATDGANPNVLASKALEGSTATTTSGRTSAPDLVSTSVNASAQQVTYCFDQPVLVNDVTGFGYYTDSGAESRGDGFFFPSGTQSCVTVQFGAGGDSPVETGDRFFVEDDSPAQGDSAVVDFTTFLDNPLGHEPQASATVRPDLTGATKVANQPSQFDFVFDEGITVNAGSSPEAFAVYQDDGTRFLGTAVAQNGPNTVRVTFGPIAGVNQIDQNNVDQIVLAGVEEDAVFSTTNAAEGNTVGDSPLTAGTNTGPGFTDGPDLLSATFNSTSNQVTYTFDERVDNTAANPVNEAAFFVFDAAGVATCGTLGTATVSGTQVTVTFATGVASAAGAGVNSDTDAQAPCAAAHGAFDFLGNGNSPDSVGGGPAPSTA